VLVQQTTVLVQQTTVLVQQTTAAGDDGALLRLIVVPVDLVIKLTSRRASFREPLRSRSSGDTGWMGGVGRDGRQSFSKLVSQVSRLRTVA